MREIHFNALDLNLIRVFDTLYEERSATRAGRRLGLSQSAVSHALNRLRYALDDELFVRAADGMTPTPRAAQIWPDLHRGLIELQRALGPGAFDPAETDRRFQIALPPAVAALLGPRLVAEVRRQAPHAQLRLRGIGPDISAGVESGAIDAAIGSFGRLPDEFAREILLQETMVWVMSAANPAAREPLTVGRLAETPLLMLAVADIARADARTAPFERRVLIDDAGAWERALGVADARRRIVMTVDDVHAALAIVAASDMAALLPRRISKRWEAARGLALFEPPYESPPLTVELLWREDGAADEGVAWLLDLIRAAAKAEMAQT